MTDDDMLDVTLTVGDVECEVSSSRVTDYEQRRVSIQLPADSFAEFIRELRLDECNSDAQAWLEEHESQEGAMSSGSGESLEKRIREEVVVDIPDDADLIGAIDDAVEIVRGSWELKLTDEIGRRDSQEKVFTYLLAAYAANIASDGERPPAVTREELIDVFGSDVAEDVVWHGWVRTYDGHAEIRPECLTHVTLELKRRYATLEGGRDG